MCENAGLLDRLIPNARFVTTEHPCTTKQLFGYWEERAKDEYTRVADFDLVYLDYLGTWARAKVEDVEFLLHRVNFSGLVITCNLKRGHATVNERLGYEQNFLPLLQENYLSLVRLDVSHCRVEPGMVVYDKMGGIPSEVVRRV